MGTRALALVAGALAAIGPGCLDTDLREPAPAVVVAEFDPGGTPPRLPLPTDLARDPVTGRITLPVGRDAPLAARDLAAYLASLDGFPPLGRATASFSAPLDPASVQPYAIEVVDLTDGERLDATARLDETGRLLSIEPEGGRWPSGHTIAVGIYGGEGGVRGAGGEEVVGSPAFFFARARRPITAGQFISAEQAAGLEPLRLALAPVFEGLEAAGVPREELVLAWSFTTSTRPFAAYDPAAGVVPFPNDLLRDPVLGRVSLPALPGDPPALVALKQQLGGLEGFSTTAPLVAPVILPPRDRLAPPRAGAVLGSVPVASVSIADGLVVIQPVAPLEELTTYFVALTRGLVTESGQPVEPSPLMVLLRSRGPLVAGGRSTVPILTDAEATRLEPLRLSLQRALDAGGVDPGEVVVAWSFTTQPTVSLLEARLAALPPVESTGETVPVPDGVPAARIGELRAGTVTGSAGLPVPYLLVLPRGATRGVVLFQHGLGADKRAVLAVADAFAGAGLAVAAIDLPLHGERAAPRRALLDPADLLGTRDRLLEAAADLEQLARALAGPGLGGVVVSGEPRLVGSSLGGVVAADFAAVRRLQAPTVLSTTGAGLADTFLTSPTLGPALEKPLTDAGVRRGSAGHLLATILVQTILDPVDPLAYAARLAGLPVRVQIAGADTVFLPASGTRLAVAAQAEVSTFAEAAHAALLDPTDPAFEALVDDALQFLLGGAR